jgi:hypothetical protein
MDWIEQLLGFNPDQGSGFIETLILGALAALALTGLAVAIPAARQRLARLVAIRSAHPRRGE